MFDFPKIKTDPKLPHHYIIGIRMNNSIWSKNTGKLTFSYGPVYFSNEDVENYRHAFIHSQDKFFKDSLKDSLKMFDCSELLGELHGIKLAAIVNSGTLHHFSVQEKLDDPDEWFELLVDLANTDSTSKKLLKDSKI